MIYCNMDAMLIILYPQDVIIIKNVLLRTSIYASWGRGSVHVHACTPPCRVDKHDRPMFRCSIPINRPRSISGL